MQKNNQYQETVIFLNKKFLYLTNLTAFIVKSQIFGHQLVKKMRPSKVAWAHQLTFSIKLGRSDDDQRSVL